MRLIRRRDLVTTYRAGNSKNRPLLGAVPDEAMIALRLAAEALTAAGASWWVAYGTLLGLVREGRLMAHDNDIDLAVHLGADTARITQEMERRGLVRVREEEWQGRPSKQKFMLGQVLVDVFYLHPRGDGFVDHNLFSRQSVLRGTHPAVKVETRRLGGLDLPVPADTEAYLHHLYGDGWRQPVKAWTWFFSGNNIELLMDWRDLPWLLVQWFKWQQRLRAR
jgi:hypothetical protein